MPQKKCSFCGRSEKEVKLLITGLDGYICEDCAQQAYKIVTKKLSSILTNISLDRMKLNAIFQLQCITITSDFSNRRMKMV